MSLGIKKIFKITLVLLIVFLKIDVIPKPLIQTFC